MGWLELAAVGAEAVLKAAIELLMQEEMARHDEEDTLANEVRCSTQAWVIVLESPGPTKDGPTTAAQNLILCSSFFLRQ